MRPRARVMSTVAGALLVWASIGAEQAPVAPPAGAPPAVPAGRGGQAPGGPAAPGAPAAGVAAGRGGGPPAPSVEYNRMNHGLFVSSTIATEPVTEKAIAVKVNEQAQAVMSFDTDLLRVSAAWTGGFLNWYAARDGLERWPSPVGTVQFTTRKGPGWSRAGSFVDPRDVPVGPLPKSWGHYKGLYLNGDNVVFSYTIGATQIFESPGFVTLSERQLFTRTLNLASTTEALSLRVLDLPDEAFLEVEPTYVRIRRINKNDNRFVAVRGLPAGAKWSIVDQQLTLQFPASQQAQRVQLLISGVMAPGRGGFGGGGGGGGARAGGAPAAPAPPSLEELMKTLVSTASTPVPDLAPLREPGPTRWPAIQTQAVTATGPGALVVDTITVPEDNPFQSWIRLSGLDFLPDGRAVVSSITGDVWLVGGIGETLGALSWKRFATGLNQPLGVKVVNNRIYVTGRDQITILNDRNNDGEADFYENFNNDVIASDNFHEFTMHLETDSKGNFYFTRGTAWPAVSGETPVPPTKHNGALLRVSPDGSRLDIVSTGLRHPNGFTIGPNDEMAFADNQGNWLPTSVVHMIRPGAHYGFKPTIQGVANPTDYEKPIVWLPHAFDNSPANPIWVPEKQWGPLGGKMLLMSYGKATLSLLMTERVDGQIQGAIMNLPLRFDSGLLRGRFRPDGHLYMVGLSNWQSDGAKKGGFHRVRYAPKPALNMPVAVNVRANGIEMTFSDPLDQKVAVDRENYNVQQAMYRWMSAYGSPMYKKSDPNAQGMDRVEVTAVQLSRDRKIVTLLIPKLEPVDQVSIGYILKAADGTELRQTIHSTINKVPAAPARR